MKYKVDINTANEIKHDIAKILNSNDKQIISDANTFASLYDFDFEKYKDPVLVMKTEEPGSKQMLAFKYNRIESISYDMINHLINDCIVMGAKPLIIQDAIICGKIRKKIIKRIVVSLSDACKRQGCILTGGETSEQPGFLGDSTYILSSSILGIVDKEYIIDGSGIKPNDIVIGLQSSGIHTNGFTLIRSIIDKHAEVVDVKVENRNFIDAILEPHRCYYNALKELFPQKTILGLAHITGGGIRNNLNRILPNNTNAEINLHSYKIQDIFKVIKKYGNVSDTEMLKTFNLGIGMIAVVSENHVENFIHQLNSNGVMCSIIGEITNGEKKVVCKGHLSW